MKTVAIISMAIMCFLGSLYLGVLLSSHTAPKAEASESSKIRQLTTALGTAQKDIRNLKAKVGVLEKLPTAAKELAAKKKNDRRRR